VSEGASPAFPPPGAGACDGLRRRASGARSGQERFVASERRSGCERWRAFGIPATVSASLSRRRERGGVTCIPAAGGRSLRRSPAAGIGRLFVSCPCSLDLSAVRRLSGGVGGLCPLTAIISAVSGRPGVQTVMAGPSTEDDRAPDCPDRSSIAFRDVSGGYVPRRSSFRGSLVVLAFKRS
jgi:hypothetical protein